MNYRLLLLLILPGSLFGQLEANLWYFGSNSGLDFSSGEPVFTTDNEMVTFEGCAVMSDAAGNLLFYTNGGGRPPVIPFDEGGTIWNRNHEVMYEMNGSEGGGNSATQSSLILPKPGTDSIYYLFTMEEIEFDVGGGFPDQPNGRGLSYFEIDMRLNGGLGGVTVADERIYVPSFEGLAATPHANGTDFWLVVNANDGSTNEFVTVLVDADGIQDDDILVQTVEDNTPFAGAIKLSPDGNWMTVGGHLYSFDNSTSVISPPLFETPFFLGSIFTPDSRYLYYIDNENFDDLFRIDLDADDLLASAQSIPTEGPPLTFFISGQIGPDGNLYFSQLDFSADFTYIGVVNCPSGPDPVFMPRLFEIELLEDGFFTVNTLPNFADYIFASLAEDGELPTEEQVICDGELLELLAPVGGDMYRWSDNSTASTLTVTNPGVYEVTVTNDCGREVFQSFVVEAELLPTAELVEPSDVFFCEGVPFSIEVITDATQVLWSTGDTVRTIEVTESGAYSVTVSNACADVVEELLVASDNCSENCQLMVPNIISANNDGNNDRFGVFTDCTALIDAYELQVYNRWGELVFESKNSTEYWLGDFQGKPAPADVYIYQLRYSYINNDDFQHAKGQFTLVR